MSSATTTHASSASASARGRSCRSRSRPSGVMRTYAATIRAAIVNTSFGRTRRRGAISGSAVPVAAAAAARSSLRSTSWVRARSRRCGVSAARCRYGRARAIESDHPASTAIAQRAFRADEDAARDEQLGHVHVERGLRRAEAGGRQVDQHRFAVHDEHVAEVQPAVRDAGVMQPSDLPAQLHEQLVAHLRRGSRAPTARARAGG